MRVALDVTPLLGARTGVGQFVGHLLHALDQLETRPDLLPWVLSGRAWRRRHPLPRDARVLPVPAGPAVALWGRADRPVLDRWLGRPHVVHGTNFVVPPTRAPAVVTVHDCWCARHPARCDRRAAAGSAALRRALARGAWAHVATEHVAAEVAEVFGTERIAVVPLGVPPVDGAGAPPFAEPYVLALGSLEPRKNLDRLVAAFGAPAGPAQRCPDLRLVLAGPDGPARPAVEAALSRLPPPVAGRVLRLGAVPDPTRRALLAGARVLAYPSLDEGFGFPVLEAMAAGVPVVASTAGALPEVAGDAALLVPPTDTDALAGALVRAVDDDGLRASLLARGRRRAASFSWVATARGLVELWARLGG